MIIAFNTSTGMTCPVGWSGISVRWNQNALLAKPFDQLAFLALGVDSRSAYTIRNNKNAGSSNGNSGNFDG